MNKSCDSVVSVLTRLRAAQSELQIPAGDRDCTLFQNVHSGTGTQPASYSVGEQRGVLSRSVKRPWPEVSHSLPSNAEVKSERRNILSS
jgi:hypothetical protein